MCYVWFSFSFTFAPKSYVCWFFSLTHVFFFSFSCISLFLSFSFMLDLIQFQHSSARHLYSCFFLIVLQLRVCFFFFCVNTTRVLFSHVFCSEDSQFLTGGHIVPVSPFFLLRGQNPKHVCFFRVCVFHFIIMQKIYYIRVVFVCLLLLVSLAFSRRYKFVNKKNWKEKKT